jgi:hypothetical protein
LNTRCILGNPIWEKTQLEGEAYALLSFLQLWKASTKKEALTMEFPLTLWPEWTATKSPTSSVMLSKYHSLDALLNYGTSTIQKNGTLSPPSGLIFNIADSHLGLGF